MEMVELSVQMGDELVAKIRDLALRYFGDDTDASQAQVLEVAFRMHCLWAHSVRKGQQETDEAVSSWEFSESPVTEENTGNISNWLFRR